MTNLIVIASVATVVGALAELCRRLERNKILLAELPVDYDGRARRDMERRRD